MYKNSESENVKLYEKVTELRSENGRLRQQLEEKKKRIHRWNFLWTHGRHDSGGNPRNPNLKGALMKILVPSHDHRYREAVIKKTKVVYNHIFKEWYEYHGDEYLDEGDEVFEVNVAI